MPLVPDTQEYRLEEMGWGKNKLKGRIEKKRERKERTTEKQQEKIYLEKSTTRILTGNRKEVKKRVDG